MEVNCSNQENSNVQATIEEYLNTFFLWGQSGETKTKVWNGPVALTLNNKSVPGPKNAVDVASGAKCSPYNLWGTWSLTP